MLKAHLSRYPLITAQDAVKLVFQAHMGVGHLLNDTEKALNWVCREMDEMAERGDEPLFEAIGSHYVRLNLRGVKNAGWAPEWVVALMMESAAHAPAANRTNAAADAFQTVLACGAWSADEVRAAVKPLTESETWLPSHSDVYRKAYAPAYRVIRSDLTQLFPILNALAKHRQQEHTLLTIDGPCGSGKSTLAALLSRILSASVIHMDDFYVPHAQKTAERLAIPGGNADVERLMEECLLPWKQHGKAYYRPYSCQLDRYMDPVEVPDRPVTIVEGSYCNLPMIRALADVRVYLTIDADQQLKRLAQRDGEQQLNGFITRWIPLEQAYHTAYGLPDADCVVLEAPSIF